MFYRPDGQSASYGNGEAKPGEIPGETCLLTDPDDIALVILTVFGYD